MIDTIVHADWSLHPPGRWAATAVRTGTGWRVEAPRPVGDLARFRGELLGLAQRGTVLAGFDFPIGVPALYGRQTELGSFRAALPVFGTADPWRDFYRPAARVDEARLCRPFYPAGNGAGTRLADLVRRLNLPDADALLRACERRGPDRKRASPLFWTVGAAQVGRAAAFGWQEAILPLLEAGAALWPFDGTLGDLAAQRGLILAETYPADAYARLGAPFRPGQRKGRQTDRAGKADPILAWAESRGIDMTTCTRALQDGFGADRHGDDAFDAFVGLLAAIPVAEDPDRAMTATPDAEQRAWEGWILGR